MIFVALGLIRPGSPNFKVLVLQVFLIAAAGFAYYFVNPTPLFAEPVLYAPPALLAVGIALALVSRRLISEIAAGQGIAMSSFRRQTMLALATRLCFILGVAGYLFVFEPWFAVANVAANLAWAALWLPRYRRESHAELATDLPSAPAAVWDFITDPANWPRYQVNVVEVSAKPPGRLQPGALITTRRKLAVSRPLGAAFETTVVLRYRVAEVVPGRSYAIEEIGRGSVANTAVVAAGSGSRLTITARFWMTAVEGYLGTALQLGWAVAEYRRITEQSLGRLREVLSAA